MLVISLEICELSRHLALPPGEIQALQFTPRERPTTSMSYIPATSHGVHRRDGGSPVVKTDTGNIIDGNLSSFDKILRPDTEPINKSEYSITYFNTRYLFLILVAQLKNGHNDVGPLVGRTSLLIAHCQ